MTAAPQARRPRDETMKVQMETDAMLTINLNERGYDCGMCGSYGPHRNCVCVDECGEPTAKQTGYGKVVCRECHDKIHPPSR